MPDKSKLMPLTVAVKTYLLQCVAKAGVKPERIMSEMQLCAKFAVSRVTVRRAIQALEQSGYLIRLPGRQGAFTNPKMAMAVPHLVGILCADGTRNYLNSNAAEILAGFTQTLKIVDCDFEFLLLNGNMDIFQEIGNMALDALFWMMPSAEQIEGINRLLQQQYPLVVLDSIYNSDSAKPVCNTVQRDYEYHALKHAQLMLQRQYKQVVKVGVYNISARAFQDEMRKNGVDLTRDFFIDCTEKITEKLSRLLNAQKIDAVICDGGMERYEKVLQTLETREEWRNTPIFMEKNHLAEKLRRKFHHLQVELTPAHYDRQALGRYAGRQMGKILRGKLKSFANVVVASKK